MRHFVASAALAAAGLFTALPAQGPIVLMGIDAEDGGVGGHGPTSVYASVVSSMLTQVTNGRTGILVVGGGSTTTTNVRQFWSAVGTAVGRPVTFVTGALNIQAVNFNNYALVGVASDSSNTPSGGLTVAENNALATRAGAMAAFINSGGGVLGFSSRFTNPYPYLADIGSFTVSTTGAQYQNVTPTTDGLAVGITATNLDVCCWHDRYLAYPSFLRVLAREGTSATTGNVAALGGSAVVVITRSPNCEVVPGHDLTVSAGQQLQFAVAGTDPDVGEVLQLVPISALPPGMTGSPAFPVTGASPVSSLLTWTPTPAQAGLHQLFFQVTDPTNKTAVCAVRITVLPNSPPTVTCPTPTTLQCTQPGANPVTLHATVADANNDNVVVTWKVDSVVVQTQTVTGGNGTVSLLHGYTLGTHQVEICITDNKSPEECCGSTVTIQDTTMPVITCAHLVERETDPGLCTWTGTLPVPEVSDNCGIASVTADRPLPATFPHGDTVVVWTVTDNANNQTTCSQIVRVEDHEPPTIECPGDISVSTDPGVCTATLASLGTPVVTDNCGILSVVNDAASLTFDLGTTIVTWTVTDTSGNTATCQQSVQVMDLEPPVLVVPPDVVVNADSGQCFATQVNIGVATATDNCGIAANSLHHNATSTTFPVGTTTITWYVEDHSGNPASGQQRVTVVDNQAPVIQVHCNSSMLWPPSHDLTSASFEVTVTDNCAAPTGGFPVAVNVFADEDDETDTGDGVHSPDMKDVTSFAVAAGVSTATSVRLRAERKGDLDGRVYLVVIRAVDHHGNVGFATCSVVVPHSKSKASIASVNNQAMAAELQGASFVQALLADDMNLLPTPYVRVGDGAVLGPKQ